MQHEAGDALAHAASARAGNGHAAPEVPATPSNGTYAGSNGHTASNGTASQDARDDTHASTVPTVAPGNGYAARPVSGHGNGAGSSNGHEAIRGVIHRDIGDDTSSRAPPTSTSNSAPDAGHAPAGTTGAVSPGVSNGTSGLRLGGDTYTPRRILVTGGAGFIASHVVVHLVRTYPQYLVVNVDKLDYCSSLRNLDQVSGAANYRFVHANVLCASAMRAVLAQYEIDTVLHFAAQTHVDTSFGNSIIFTQNNVMGTHVLLEAAKEHGIRRFVHVSTDEVYGEVVSHAGANEHSILEPTNPYAATKAAAEFLVKAYHRSFQMPVIITRGNNVYGPHQYPEKLIPKFINLLQRGQRLPIHGSGMNRRTFIYVTDVARAFDVILHRAKPGDVLNIGNQVEHTNLDVARALLQLFGIPEERHDDMLYHVEDRKFNDARYWIDSSRLRQLGWRQEVPWEDGLRRTVQWYTSLDHDPWGDINVALHAHPVPQAPSLCAAPVLTSPDADCSCGADSCLIHLASL